MASGGGQKLLANLPSVFSGLHLLAALVVMALIIPAIAGAEKTPGRPGSIASSYQIQWIDVTPPSTMRPLQRVQVPVKIRNSGSRVIPAKLVLSYHWFPKGNRTDLSLWDGVRTGMPHDLAPGKTFAGDMIVQAPANPGAYECVFDMVEEGVNWLSGLGSPMLTRDVRVEDRSSYSSPYSIQWVRAFMPTKMKARSEDSFEITLRNNSTRVLRGAMAISYHWRPVGMKNYLPGEGLRTAFSREISPGELYTADVVVICPALPGEYELVFDLVEEGIAWFSDRGGAALERQVRILP